MCCMHGSLVLSLHTCQSRQQAARLSLLFFQFTLQTRVVGLPPPQQHVQSLTPSPGMQ